MNGTNEFERDDDDILSPDVPDAALGAAAGAGPGLAGAFTFNLCTVMSDCPA
jgi:hypothetical protein